MTQKGHPFRPFTQAEDAVLLAGKRAGRSDQSIAEELDRPLSSIGNRRRRIERSMLLEDDDDQGGAMVSVQEPSPGVRIVTHRLVG
jgi:hypothetical protein